MLVRPRDFWNCTDYRKWNGGGDRLTETNEAVERRWVAPAAQYGPID